MAVGMPPHRGHFASAPTKPRSERTFRLYISYLRPLIDIIQTVVLLIDLPDEVGRRVSTLCLI